MTRIITDAQAKYAHEHSQLVSGPEMRRELSNEWDAYIANVRAVAWEVGWSSGVAHQRAIESGEFDEANFRNPHRAT